MISLLRALTRAVEVLLGMPARLVRVVFAGITFNPRLGVLRHLATAVVAYLAFAVVLVYIAAPLRGVIGHYLIGERIRYDAERWMATAIYDRHGQFIGTFDPRLDSQRDVNWTDAAIELDGHTANPDHKSIPVANVPEYYWKCLSFHEDRYSGGVLNPYGIDLLGVLKIPYSSIRRSIALRRPVLGAGGSTLPMQFARVIYKTPPDPREGSIGKLRRKITEWWLAPVIYHELTRGGDDTPLKQWAANHLWLAQRAGGAPLHGVEMTSRVVFGKEAKDLTVAEQFVLASAVNKPIILLAGSERLNEVRLDHWRYITEVRARKCAERLVDNEALRGEILFELVSLAGGPPDPKVKPGLQAALETFAPDVARRATANPTVRANALLPVERFGIREELKQTFGFAWRDKVRGVRTTLDVVENLGFRERVKIALRRLDQQHQASLNPGFTLDPARTTTGSGLRIPHVIVVAANAQGEIVRYFDLGETAAYFGSPAARAVATGRYLPEREPRRIASTGKMLLAIAAGNQNRDGTDTPYLDASAPGRGLETCARGDGGLIRGRRAEVAFACSLNRPLEWRAAALGQARMARLIHQFGFVMPPAAREEEATPPSTAAVRGLVAGAPQRVHRMAAVILAALTGRGDRPVGLPTMIRRLHEAGNGADAEHQRGNAPRSDIVPDRIVRPHARAFVRAMLEAPLCYRLQGSPHGTLKSLSDWCARDREGLRLHFAKTGTDTTADPAQTVDTWVAGGLQFASGNAYSYVVLVGTGSTREPFARNLHAAQVAAPLLAILLADLEAAERRGRSAAKSPVPKSAPRIEPRGQTRTEPRAG
jgi:membrane peptidoglycan carboxypeptidase